MRGDSTRTEVTARTPSRPGLGAFGRVELIPGVLAVGIFIALAVSQGGFAVTSWGPAGLFLLGLLVIAAVAYRDRLRDLHPANRVALALLAAFVAWNFASIIWADVQGVAWDGANRSLVYLIVYALFSTVLWRSGSTGIVLALYAIGLATVGMVAVADAAGSADAASSLINVRFAEPTGYPNAVAALFIGGFWPAMVLASRPETPWPARGLMLATAGVLIQIALLPQSRGALIVFPIALLIYLVVVPNRSRALLHLALVGIATVLAAPPILDVFEVASNEGDIGAALTAARNAILLSAGSLLMVGSAFALLEDRLSISERTTRVAGWAVAVVATLGACVALVFAVVAIGDPGDWADARWEDFKGDYDRGGFGSSRFSGDLGSGRYDFWKVALEEQFADSPLIGGGSDNFAVTYLQNRESTEEPLYPHSLPVRVLAGTGIIGALLLVAFAAAAVVAVTRSRIRAGTPFDRSIAAVALATAAYFALHSSGDWLWTFTAITAPVFAWLGMAAGFSRRPSSSPAPEDDRGRSGPTPLLRFAGIGLAGLATMLAVASLLLPWAAARDVERATAGWGADPDDAFERLDRASALNYLSPRPDLVAGTIALRLDETDRAYEAFERALEREPTNWYAWLELGTLDVLDGRKESAVARLERAAELNPAEPLIATALRRAETADPLTPEQIDEQLIDRICSRVGRTAETQYCEPVQR